MALRHRALHALCATGALAMCECKPLQYKRLRARWEKIEGAMEVGRQGKCIAPPLWWAQRSEGTLTRLQRPEACDIFHKLYHNFFKNAISVMA